MNEYHVSEPADEPEADGHPAGTIQVIPWRRPSLRAAALAGLMLGASVVSVIVHFAVPSTSSPGG